MVANKQHRQNTNPYNSGGGGFDVEDRYTALCMACWLSGARPPGCVVPANYSLSNFVVQAPKDAWLFDDLVITFEGEGARKQIGTSIKSGNYLKDGLPPSDLVEDLWRQVLGKGVQPLSSNDELIIAVPAINPVYAKDWRELGEWARAQTNDAFETNVAKSNVGNDFKRSLIDAFQCPDEVSEGHTPDQLRVGCVLRRLRLVEQDYRTPSDSRLVEEAINYCSSALADGSRNNAENLWNHLLRVAESMRPNAGELTYEKLLKNLRGEHQLAAHPDNAADWSLIDAETERRLNRIFDSIGGLKLNRDPVVSSLRASLHSSPLVALLAESGEGKTVCAKRLADALRTENHRVVWLEPDQMCSADGPGRKLGIQGSLEALLPHFVESSAILIVDQVDQYDNVGLQHLVSLLRDLSAWKIVFTSTPEGWRRVEQRIFEPSREYPSAQIIHLPQLTSEEIRVVSERHTSLGRILEDQRLRQIVLRPRILDLIAQEAVTLAAASLWVSEADVIDWFFETVVERNKGDGRRSMIVRLAARLADGLAVSLPEDEVDPAEGNRIAELYNDRILRIEDGRLAFDHPLLADWSKRQYLVGRGDQVADDLTSNERKDNPAWHRGLTLFGLRLIEQRKNVQEFMALLNDLEPDGVATSSGNSLLACVMTATDPADVLNTLWPILSEDDGLLQRVLRVNHYAGTVPHPRIQDKHLRQPVSWHYPLLVQWLQAKQVEATNLAPIEVATIAETWLREAGQLPKFPARHEATALAITLVTAARADAQDDRFAFDGKEPAFRALLAAAPVSPESVLPLLRSCAERVPDDPSARPQHVSPSNIGITIDSHGDPPPTSPDAPLRPVDHVFCKVCHDWVALEPLLLHSPEVASEVILATLLRPADSLCYGYDSLDKAASSGADWSPAMWWYGPFARLLRVDERVGIDLILRLVNYVTEVWQHDAEHSNYRNEGPIPHMEIEVDGIFRRWPGGGLKADNVFSWYSLGHRCPTSVQCALMALEHYLYEAEADGRKVDATIEQILSGSKSASFAGLLAAVANHRRDLLGGSLQPLLTCAEAVWHDDLRSKNREDRTCAGIGLPLKPQFIQDQVGTWYCMEHRDTSLLAPLMLLAVRDNPPSLFERVRNRLTERMENSEVGGVTCPISLLAAWYEPANWRTTDTPQGLQIQFVRPLHLQTDPDETRRMQRDQAVLFLPMQARQLIDEVKPPDDNGMEQLWVLFEDLASSWQNQDSERPAADAAAGIVAVAIILRLDWLERVEGRYERAVELIDDIAASPPPASEFDSPGQVYDCGWDAFHADVAGFLYAREPANRDCRDRVIRAVTGYHYIVVGRFLQAFAHARNPQHGPTLGPLINFIIQFAALREAYRVNADVHKRIASELQAVTDSFLEGRIEDQLQPWSAAGDRWGGVLCESTITQIIESAPRPSEAKDNFFVEPAWPLVIEHGIDWLVRASMANAKTGDDESEEDDFEVGSGHRVGYKLLNEIVRLAAEAVVHTSSEEWFNRIMNKCLTFRGKKYGAREGFASWFASYATGDSNDQLPTHAVPRWVALAKAVFEIDEHDAAEDDLQKATLGLSLMSQYSWPQQATAAATALTPYFERWIKAPARDVQDAETFAFFLIRPAAEAIQLDGIVWLASNSQLLEPHIWRYERDRQPLVSLLDAVGNALPLGRRPSQVRNAVIELLSMLAAAGDGRASDLLRSFGTAS